jgi:hypothetical protein
MEDTNFEVSKDESRPINPFPDGPIIWCDKYKLGRKAVKTDSRTLKLASYLTPALPAPPVSVDWTKGVKEWGMLANDTLGDCTIAGAMHAIMGWSLNSGAEVAFTTNDAISYYEKFDGYSPSDPNTDQGGVLLDVLRDWKNQGINSHKIDAYASADASNLTEVKQALSLFGPLYAGLSFPNSAQGQSEWVVTNDTSIDGGHCVVIIGYNATGPVAISWGALYQMTWEFFSKYFDELFAIVSPDWFNASGIDPTGLNLAQLDADLKAIR